MDSFIKDMTIMKSSNFVLEFFFSAIFNSRRRKVIYIFTLCYDELYRSFGEKGNFELNNL